VKLKNIIVSSIFMYIILIVFEIISSTVLPAFFSNDLRPNFYILFTLFICFFIDLPVTALLIYLVQLVHSAFSFQGWAEGTFIGVLFFVIFNYLKEYIRLSRNFYIIIISFLSMLVWSSITFLFMYLKTSNSALIISKLFPTVVESFLLALTAPFLFAFLSKVWSVEDYREGYNF
jgi:hypothetical protein